jgi:hypothetical protein
MSPGNQAPETFVQIVLDEVKRNVERVDELLDLLPDSKLSRRTKMPSDCGLFILGHLTSRLDILIESLGIARQRFHELEEIFVPDCAHDGINQLSGVTLRASWNIISKILMLELSHIPTTDWLAYPPDNNRLTKLALPRHSRIAILLSFSHDIAYSAGRLSRVA